MFFRPSKAATDIEIKEFPDKNKPISKKDLQDSYNNLSLETVFRMQQRATCAGFTEDALEEIKHYEEFASPTFSGYMANLKASLRPGVVVSAITTLASLYFTGGTGSLLNIFGKFAVHTSFWTMIIANASTANALDGNNGKKETNKSNKFHHRMRLALIKEQARQYQPSKNPKHVKLIKDIDEKIGLNTKIKLDYLRFLFNPQTDSRKILSKFSSSRIKDLTKTQLTRYDSELLCEFFDKLHFTTQQEIRQNRKVG